MTDSDFTERTRVKLSELFVRVGDLETEIARLDERLSTLEGDGGKEGDE